MSFSRRHFTHTGLAWAAGWAASAPARAAADPLVVWFTVEGAKGHAAYLRHLLRLRAA